MTETNDITSCGWNCSRCGRASNPIHVLTYPDEKLCAECYQQYYAAKYADKPFQPVMPLPTTEAERPTVVCLCGSGRFREAFEKAEFDETLAGKIVLTIGCNCHDVARSADLAKHKPMLDELHLRKIDLADEVLILNVSGYVGESTRRELEYAKMRGKRVRFLETEQ